MAAPLRTDDVMDDARKTKTQLLDEIVELRQQLTALKATKAEHQYPRDWFRAVLASLSEAVYTVDTEGRVTFANRAFALLTGYTISEVLGQPSHTFYTPEAWIIFAERRRLALLGKPVEPFLETTLVRRDGTMVVVELFVTSLTAGDRVIGRIGVLREATARKEAETTLREWAAIVASTDDAIIGKTLEGTITSWNPGAEHIYGYTAAEVLGRSITLLVPPDRPREVTEILATIRHGEHIHHYDTQRITKHGTRLDISLTISPLTDHHDHIVGASTISRDITERKRAETELHRRNRDLETLLHVVSHDLQEPLRAIQSFSHIVTERYANRLDEKGEDFLRRIVRATQRMEALLGDIVTLSRARRIAPAAEEVDSASIVHSALRQLESTITITGAQVRMAPGLPHLCVNRGWAIQAVYNLISNALKFTQDGHPPEVEIAPYRVNDEVGIVVRDRGPGVAPAHAERVFRLFQRGATWEVPGTGAGLAIVQQIAERHGGRAWVQAREGGGAEFVVTFGRGKIPKEGEHAATVRANVTRRGQ